MSIFPTRRVALLAASLLPLAACSNEEPPSGEITPLPYDDCAAPAGKPGAGKDITWIGDSLTYGALETIERVFPGIDVDGKNGRTFGQGLRLLEEKVEEVKLRKFLVFALPNNAAVSSSELATLKRLAGTSTVVLTTGHVVKGSSYVHAKGWIDENNTLLRASGLPIADWETVSSPHDDYFTDGIHLTARASVVFVHTIAGALAKAGGPAAFTLPECAVS